MTEITRLPVVVTSNTCRHFVCTAVDRALAQARVPLQVIVVDDGSTDDSPALPTAGHGNDPRVTLLTGGNGGQLAAFQRGLAEVRGDVVCLLGADDRWPPEHLARIGGAFDACADVDVVCSDLPLFGQQSARMRCADPARQELKARPLPSWREARRDASLVRLRRDSRSRGAERALSVLRSPSRRRALLAECGGLS